MASVVFGSSLRGGTRSVVGPEFWVKLVVFVRAVPCGVLFKRGKIGVVGVQCVSLAHLKHLLFINNGG